MTYGQHQARALRLARAAADLTQEQLAARLGVTLRSVQRAEGGRTSPRPDLIQSWAAACGMRLVVQLIQVEPSCS